MRADGYEKVIVGIRQNNFQLTRENLSVARREFAIPPDCYVYPWLGGDTAQRTRQALEAFGPLSARIWVDAEDNGHGASGLPNPAEYPAALVIEKIEACFSVLDAAAFPSGYYGARWWHLPATDDYQGWAHRPLWVADYDGVDDLRVWGRFGGWNIAHAKQYQGTTPLAGILVDLNVIRV